jgi:phosphoribosylglycinamide formyltransferase 2
MSTTPPIICIVNAVDTLRTIARKADCDEEYHNLVNRSFYQQDQAFLWGGARKLVITSKPIGESEWLSRTLSMPDTVNLTPKNETDNIFMDILADESLIEKIISYCGEEKLGRVIPHTNVDSLYMFQREMERRYGVRLELPESPQDLSLRNELDRKSGFRKYIEQLAPSFSGVRLPEGVVCENLQESMNTVRAFLAAGKACIAKADRGEASIGLNIFKNAQDLKNLERELSSNTFLQGEPIVVEEFIHGDDVFFPSIEYDINADKSVPPRMTHICEMLFEGETNLVANVTSSDFNKEEWSKNFHKAGDIIARDLQARGYVGHFGMDCVAKRGGDVYLLEMNPRRTGSTHLDDFGTLFFGPDYGRSMTIGHYDFFMNDRSFKLGDVLKTLGDLVQSPVHKDAGVLPFEMSGFSSGRLSFMIFTKSFANYLDLVETVRHSLEASPVHPSRQPPNLSPKKLVS